MDFLYALNQHTKQCPSPHLGRFTTHVLDGVLVAQPVTALQKQRAQNLGQVGWCDTCPGSRKVKPDTDIKEQGCGDTGAISAPGQSKAAIRQGTSYSEASLLVLIEVVERAMAPALWVDVEGACKKCCVVPGLKGHEAEAGALPKTCSSVKLAAPENVVSLLVVLACKQTSQHRERKANRLTLIVSYACQRQSSSASGHACMLVGHIVHPVYLPKQACVRASHLRKMSRSLISLNGDSDM